MPRSSLSQRGWLSERTYYQFYDFWPAFKLDRNICTHRYSCRTLLKIRTSARIHKTPQSFSFHLTFRRLFHLRVVQSSFILEWGLAPCMRSLRARTRARAIWLKIVFARSHHADRLRWLISYITTAMKPTGKAGQQPTTY